MYFVLHKTFFAEKTGGREGVEKDKWILAGKSVGDKERRKKKDRKKGKEGIHFPYMNITVLSVRQQ